MGIQINALDQMEYGNGNGLGVETLRVGWGGNLQFFCGPPSTANSGRVRAPPFLERTCYVLNYVKRMERCVVAVPSTVVVVVLWLFGPAVMF